MILCRFIAVAVLSEALYLCLPHYASEHSERVDTECNRHFTGDLTHRLVCVYRITAFILGAIV